MGQLAAMGRDEVDVVEIDVHGPAATRLALALNRTSELGTWNLSRLAELAEDLEGRAEDLGMDDLLDDALRPLDVGGGKTFRATIDHSKHVFVAMMVAFDESGDVERALDKAMEQAENRSAALAIICREWLAHDQQIQPE